ncbi:hypothetical protein JW865_07795 [Candidatus Bathyarchaeota archaeon]|nr:hypothetical protein [Candidatus Bathyarchaeota archaeon]
MKLSANNQYVETLITLKYVDIETAKIILNAVIPDNTKLPNDLVIEMSRKDKEIKILIKCKKGVGTMLNTIDDLLECVSTAEKVIKKLS